MTHICVDELTIIASDNGLSPGRRQAIIWTNAGILSIEPLGINFSEMTSILSRPQCVKYHDISISDRGLASLNLCVCIIVIYLVNGMCTNEQNIPDILTLFCWIDLRKHKQKYFLLSCLNSETNCWNNSSWKAETLLFYTTNSMAPYEIVTKGAWPTATIVFTYLSICIPVSTHV